MIHSVECDDFANDLPLPASADLAQVPEADAGKSRPELDSALADVETQLEALNAKVLALQDRCGLLKELSQEEGR